MGPLSELRVVAEYRQLRRSSLWAQQQAPPGAGRPVVLLNGFGLPPATLDPLGRWLRAGGWSVRHAPCGWNLSCGEATVERVSAEIEALHDELGPVALVGHSRGGLLARVAAVRHPVEVSHLVTVCTPWTLGPPDAIGIATASRAIRFARRRGIDVLSSIDCRDGSCCAALRADMARDPRATWTGIWSSRDSIGGPQSEVPAVADHIVDIRTSHMGAVASTAGWKAIGEGLASSR